MVRKTPVFVLLAFSLFMSMTGCGKRGDPLPPFKYLPYNLFRLQVDQQGGKAVVRLVVPRTTQEGEPFEKEHFGKLEIYCLAEKDTGETEREFEEIDMEEEKDTRRGDPLGGMPGGGGMKVISGGAGGGMPGDSAGWESIGDDFGSTRIDTSSFRGTGTTDIFPRDVFERKSERVFVVEKEDIDEYAVGWRFTVPIDLKSLSEEDIYEKRLYFAVKLFNHKGQDDGLSNLATLAPEVVPDPPKSLAGETTQAAILLTWEKPDTMADGTELKEDIGYLVFRAPEGQDFNPLPLNAQPLKETAFADKSFRFNKTYRYMVRATDTTDKGSRESDNSMELTIQTRDIFPPGVPQGVNSVKGEKEITLIWSPNLEDDLKGYHVYRSTEEETGFIKLNDAPLTKNAFTDEDVEVNTTYYYRITAEDNASPPNESDSSETVAEKLT